MDVSESLSYCASGSLKENEDNISLFPGHILKINSLMFVRNLDTTVINILQKHVNKYHVYFLRALVCSLQS